tara:strand:- start:314 stop:493 length:180 start_codon:yes stop_codon:yes gene_type:complete
MKENKKLMKKIWDLIFFELPILQVAKLKVMLDEYVDELLCTCTEEDEQKMLDIINQRTP